MARTIGVKYKNQLKKIVDKAWADGVTNNQRLFAIVQEQMPDAFDTWERAYHEIKNLVWEHAQSKVREKLEEFRR